MYYCYILQLKNKEYYIGFSADLKQRIKEHKAGRVAATKPFLPLKLEFYASFSKKSKAMKFEKYLKTQSGYAFRNKRLI